LFSGAGHVVFLNSPRWQLALGAFAYWPEHLGFWALIFFALLPLAMTMALLWKTKGVILDSVFGTK
jgi:hypothetical protein